MSYWNDEPVYVQVKRIMAANPKLSRKEALGMVVRSGVGHRTNPPRKRFSGAQEIARRRVQIERRTANANN